MPVIWVASRGRAGYRGSKIWIRAGDSGVK